MNKCLHLILVLASTSAAAFAHFSQSSDERFAVLEGIVRDKADGRPLDNATVECGPIRSTTGMDGRFTVERLVPGACVITLSRKGYLPETSSGTPVDLRPSDHHPVHRLEMIREARLSGSVTDSSKRAIPGVTLYAMRSLSSSNRRALETLATATSERDGSFAFGGLRPGAYLILASPPRRNRAAKSGEAPIEWTPTFYPGSEDLAGALPIRLNAGDDQQAFRLELREARVHDITGTIQSAVGQRQSNQAIKLEFTRRLGGTILVFIDQIRSPLRQPYERLDVNPDGTFVITGVSEGSYDIGFVTRHSHFPLLSLEMPAKKLTKVNITIPPFTSLRGKVVSPQGIEPPAKINLVRVEGGRLQTTYVSINKEGEFVVTDLVPGLYRAVIFNSRANYYIEAINYNGVSLNGGNFVNDGGGDGRLDVILSDKLAKLKGRAPPGAGSVLTFADGFEEIDE